MREEDQIAAMGKIVTLNLTVRQAEELARRIKAVEVAEEAAEEVLAASAPRRSPDLDDLEAQFRDALTVKVDLKYNARGKGTLVLHFNNQEELERLYGQLVKKEV
jgi:ParB family chromosome partitioning protein